MEGSACLVSNNRLALDTNQLVSDCGATTYCSQGACRPRGCRRDEYPFGYDSRARDSWPPLCAVDQFCPDEGSSCMRKQSVGQPCQLNRDDECAAPPNFQPICLHYKCQYVNATVGQACINENVVYTVFQGQDARRGEVISRDNCVDGYYCDARQLLCIAKVPDGGACSADKECQSLTCGASALTLSLSASGRCSPRRSSTLAPLWTFVVVPLALLIASLALCTALLSLHARQRRAASRTPNPTLRQSSFGRVLQRKKGVRSPTLASPASYATALPHTAPSHASSRDDFGGHDAPLKHAATPSPRHSNAFTRPHTPAGPSSLRRTYGAYDDEAG